MRRILLALLAAVVLSVPANAFAYAYLYTCGPTWQSLPVDYWINSNGSADLGFSTVENIVQDSFDVWGQPCCSGFSADYRGTTSLTATNNQGRIVLSWTEQNWDPSWGSVNSVIGITFTQVFNNCTIAGAPIIFNGIGFRFTNGGGGTDLQSIATHEIGHLLGLSHSSIQSATMFASYVGGTGARSLHQDDQDGVCSLYTQSCSCSSNSQCTGGQECIGGQCRTPPCSSDADCDDGLECYQGTCSTPRCSSDAECGIGFSCTNSVCVADCPVCRRNCQTDTDCGNGGYCLDDGSGATVCIVLCANNSECQGDAECYQVGTSDGGTAYACGAPGTSSELCPSDYVCRDDVTNECLNNQDCSNGLVCRNTTDGNRCIADEDLCADVECGPGLFCLNGSCYQEDISNNQPGTTGGGNNTTGGGGNNANNGGGGSTTGNNGSSGGETPTIIVYPAEEEPDTTCSSVAPSAPASTGWLVAVALGFLAARRRR